MRSSAEPTLLFAASCKDGARAKDAGANAVDAGGAGASLVAGPLARGRQFVLPFPFELSLLAATKPVVLRALARIHADRTKPRQSVAFLRRSATVDRDTVNRPFSRARSREKARVSYVDGLAPNMLSQSAMSATALWRAVSTGVACIAFVSSAACTDDRGPSDDSQEEGALVAGASSFDLGTIIRDSVLLCRGSVSYRSREVSSDELPDTIEGRIAVLVDQMPEVTLVEGVPVSRNATSYYVVFRSLEDRTTVGYAVRFEGGERPSDGAPRRAAILLGFDLEGNEVVTHEGSFPSSNGRCPPCQAPRDGAEPVCEY